MGTQRIAVVGAGAAGTTAAFRLAERLGDAAAITVFEREGHAGGRAWDVEFAGERVEIGGTVLHSTGEHTMRLMEFTGSTETESGLNVDGKDETYAFWTDKGFEIFTKSSLTALALGIVRHVGPFSALKVTNSAKALAARWDKIYELQRQGQAFVHPDDLLITLGLMDATQVSLADSLRGLGVNDKMIFHVVEPIVHNMYNQGVEIGALAGEVGLAGAGLAGGYLYSIAGGNWTLFQKTLEKIGAELHFDTAVTRIATASNPTNGGYEVTTADGQTRGFDAVVLAAPLALADIELEVDGRPLDVPVHPYQRVHIALVAGELSAEYFGDRAGRLPSHVFVSDAAGAPFKSLGTTGYSDALGSRLYKFFSADHELTDAEIAAAFTKISDVLRFTWRGAYPVIAPGIKHLPFRLHPLLYYACAFETAAGAIEVEAVGGWNTAELLLSDLA